MQDELPPGTHLTSPRWGYLHHGIYAGGGRVIHYAGFNRPFRRGQVEEVPLERFTCGRALQVKPCAAPKFSGAAAVERARARLGENRYRFWSNNCEHFAEWCISGTSRSPQVDAWTTRLRGGVEAVASLLAVRGSARPSAS
jgi:Lecithin retinol acyltransferase